MFGFTLMLTALAAPPSEIAYLDRTQPGAAQVRIVALETGAVRAVGPARAQGRPQWSPDGRTIAITIESSGGAAIYLADAAGAGGREIGHAFPDSHEPVWSPDGSRLAYTSGRGLDAQIVVYEPAGARETLWGGGRTSLTSPVWTSSRMAQFLIDPGQRGLITIPRPFRSEAGTADLLLAVGLVRSAETLTSDLFVVSELEATILNESLLPSTGVYAEFGPAVAAEMLAFESNDGGDREIFMISRRRTFDVSNHRSADWAPVWSPDGRSLAFQSFRGGRSGIYQCAPRRAAHIHAVAVDAAGNCWGAAWSPRSDQIAFVSDAEGAPAVYVVDVDGSDRRRITPAGISADLPSWRPIP